MYHVRGDPARLTLHEVFSRSVLVIGYHDLGLTIGILLVLIHPPTPLASCSLRWNPALSQWR